jgi:hypothetical protein
MAARRLLLVVLDLEYDAACILHGCCVAAYMYSITLAGTVWY